jgi:hypothetical protein
MRAVIDNTIMTPVKIRTQPNANYRPLNPRVTTWRHQPSGCLVISIPLADPRLGPSYRRLALICDGKSGELLHMETTLEERDTHDVLRRWWQRQSDSNGR